MQVLCRAGRVAGVPDLRIYSATPDHAIGSVGSTALYVWRGVTRLEAMPILDVSTAAAAAAAASSGGVLTLFGIVEEGAELPSSEVRKALAIQMEKLGALGGVASALVFEGSGFRAAAVRGVATGLAIVARQPYAHRVFSNVPDAARWIVADVQARGIMLDLLGLIEAVAMLRSR